MLMTSTDPVRLRRGQQLTIPDLIKIIEDSGHPDVLAIPAWAWTVISMAIRFDLVVRTEGDSPFFWMGCTKVVPTLPPDRLSRVEVEEYTSDIITPDDLRN